MRAVSPKKSGFTLLEVVIASAIIATALLAILTAYGFFVRAENGVAARVQATFLAEEGIEAARYLRDAGWTANIKNLSTTSAYYLAFASSSGTGVWTATTAPQTALGIFARKITFGQVYRNATTGNISTTSAGSSVDPNTRKASVSVSWSDALGSSSETISAYLTNLNNN